MTLFKNVNGFQVEMSPEEEQAILDEWNAPKPPAYATAAEAKAAMVQWIDRMTAKVLSRYPESVRVRWPEEEAAARAVKAGTATSEQTTLITDEGAAKGRTPTEHADIIIGHADNFRTISSEVNKLFLSVDAALDAEADPAQYEVILDDAKAQAETLAAAYGLG